ncbi:MAG TPA: hypothetical protein VET25_04970, partial [Aestuariivirgaceae bacterium]|nr:hypothetical protein [Aestuariivirgaceae bacterium]
MTAAFSLPRDSLQAHEPPARLIRMRRLGYQRLLLLKSQFNIHYFWEKKWFFIALLIGFIVIRLPTP